MCQTSYLSPEHQMHCDRYISYHLGESALCLTGNSIIYFTQRYITLKALTSKSDTPAIKKIKRVIRETGIHKCFFSSFEKNITLMTWALVLLIHWIVLAW